MTSIVSLFSLFPDGEFIISISGESGVGKTTLALQFVGFMLTAKNLFTHQCFWIQASEQFPIRRLRTLYKYDLNALQYLLKNILIFPPNGVIADYPTQSKIVSSLSDRVFPPNVNVIVLDNISHHLRYWLMQQNDLYLRREILDEFYTHQLFPLFMRCQREHIYLMVIHEMSYNTKEQKVIPFLFQLYERLGMLSINLSKHPPSSKKILEIQNSQLNVIGHFNYRISNRGIRVLYG